MWQSKKNKIPYWIVLLTSGKSKMSPVCAENIPKWQRHRFKVPINVFFVTVGCHCIPFWILTLVTWIVTSFLILAVQVKPPYETGYVSRSGIVRCVDEFAECRIIKVHTLLTTHFPGVSARSSSSARPSSLAWQVLAVCPGRISSHSTETRNCFQTWFTNIRKPSHAV